MSFYKKNKVYVLDIDKFEKNALCQYMGKKNGQRIVKNLKSGELLDLDLILDIGKETEQ